jgi:two-component system sensor histidine kinase YesM
MSYIATNQGQPFSWYGSLYQDLLQSPTFQTDLKNENQLSNNFEYGQGDQTLYVNYANLDVNDWRVVSVQLKSELLAGLGDIQRFTLLVGFICLLLSLGLSYWLAATITRPIGVLRNLMRRVEDGDFATRFNLSYENEIGDLGRSFNSMIEQTQQLLAQVKTEQSAKRQAELRALQAQINPHFLYNTLDSIYWKALMKETEAVSEMAVSLSKLFRLGLNSGHEITTVAKELEHVRNYLEIQQLCYGDTFAYIIKAQPEVAELKIVKLILQPLVENSLLHGFANFLQKEGQAVQGKIEIAAYLDKATGQLCMRVCDNGSGFDVAEISQRLTLNETGLETSSKNERGYALSNVHARLQLHYGAAYQLEMSSLPYERTCLEIRVPIETAQNSLPAEQNSPINIIS